MYFRTKRTIYKIIYSLLTANTIDYYFPQQANILTPYKLGCLNILKAKYQSILKYLLAIFSVVILGDCLGLSLTVSNIQASKLHDDFMASEKELLLSLKFRRDKEAKKTILYDKLQQSDVEELM